NIEGRARADSAFEPQPATMCFGQPLGNSQPQARPAALAQTNPRLAERLENEVVILWSDARTRILNEDHEIIVLSMSADSNTARLCKLAGVRNEVEQYLT